MVRTHPPQAGQPQCVHHCCYSPPSHLLPATYHAWHFLRGRFVVPAAPVPELWGDTEGADGLSGVAVSPSGTCPALWTTLTPGCPNASTGPSLPSLRSEALTGRCGCHCQSARAQKRGQEKERNGPRAQSPAREGLERGAACGHCPLSGFMALQLESPDKRQVQRWPQ